MRMLARNKQKLKYSLFLGRQPIYVTDEEGNPVIEYVDDDGNIYYKETGSYTSGWSIPVEFFANISQSSGEAEATAYGLSIADYDAVIITSNGYVPLAEGSRIWQNSEVSFKDEENTDVDDKSADYAVVRVLNSLNATKYLLKAVVK